MLTVNMVFRKAMKGELDLMGPAMAVANELMSIPEFGDAPEGVFAEEYKALEGFKKSILMIAGSAVQKLMQTLAKEQERSEEHTSELQSRPHLVCRLLL